MANLKLYVWEDVLSDYTEGIMFAFAENVEQARQLLSEKMTYDHPDFKIEPKEITEPAAFYVYGGG